MGKFGGNLKERVRELSLGLAGLGRTRSSVASPVVVVEPSPTEEQNKR